LSIKLPERECATGSADRSRGFSIAILLFRLIVLAGLRRPTAHEEVKSKIRIKNKHRKLPATFNLISPMKAR
jgi:hypothetical protein